MDGVDSQARTFTEDGVRIRHWVETEQFPAPAASFDVQSERDDSVQVRLVAELPAGASEDAVSFHAEYGGEYWTVNESHVGFERTFEPGEEYVTAYTLRDAEAAEMLQVANPVIDVRAAGRDDGVEGVEDVVDAERSTAVREFVAGERDDLPGPASAATTGDGNATAVPTTDRPADGQTAAAATADGDQASPASGSVARALVDELRDGTLSDEEYAVLREEIGGPTEPSRSTEARVEQVETRVSEISAYTSALEEFLDENGSAEEVIDELRAEIRTLDRELEEVRDYVADVEQEVSGLSQDISELEQFHDRMAGLFDRGDERP